MIDAILKEKNPQLAEALELWASKYRREFNFDDNADQANFYEGMLELARIIATTGQGALVGMATCSQGVANLHVSVVSRQTSSPA